MLHRAGERRDQQVEQLADADAGQRGHAQHRVEVPAGHRGLQVGDQVGDGELLTAQVAVHEGLVLALADDPLDQLAPEPVGLLLPRPPELGAGVRLQQRAQAGDRAVGPALQQVQRQHAVPQQRAAGAHGVVDVGTRAVQLGDDDGAGHADRRTLLPQLHRGRVDPADGGDDEQRGVGGAQAGAQLADEVRRAGGVQQGDAVPGVLDGGHAEGHRTLLADLHLLAVQARGAVLDAAGTGQGAGGDQQRLGEGGLARGRVAHQGHVAHLLGRPRARCGDGLLAHADQPFAGSWTTAQVPAAGWKTPVCPSGSHWTT